MRPKNKNKSDSGSARSSVDNNSNSELQQAARSNPKSGAFSYIKSRLFHAGSAPSTGQKYLGEVERPYQNALVTPTSHETSNIHGATESSAGKLDIPINTTHHRSASGNMLSKSFEPLPNQNWEGGPGNAINTRPVSVLGLEGVIKQIEAASGNSAKLSELHNLHSRQLSSMITPVQPSESRSKQILNSTKRLSGIVIKEGYLFKKTDFKTFSRTARLDRSWKGYHVVLRGHKLYLYRAQHENALKAYFPSPKDHNMSISHSNASIDSQSPTREVFSAYYQLLDKGMEWLYSDFDPDSQTVLYSICKSSADAHPTSHNPEYFYGDCFTEVDNITGAYKGYFCLLVFKTRLLICQKEWSKTKGTDTTTNRNGAGQPCNRWNIDLDVSLESVQLSHGTIEVDKKSSEEGMQGVMDPETEDLASRSTLKTRRSTASLSSHVVELDIAPPGHTAKLSRHFVPTSTDAGSRWTECFTHAKRRIDQHTSAPWHALPFGIKPESVHQGEKSNFGPLDDSSSLILKEYRVPSEYFDYRDIQGGTVDELFNELLRVRKDYLETGYVEFVRAFLLTYPLFTTSTELISALKKGIIAFASDAEAGQGAMRRAYQIIQIWCKDFRADIVGEVATGLLDILDMDLWRSECDTPHITPDSITDSKKIVLASVDDNAKIYETSVALDSKAVEYDVKINTVIKSSELHHNKSSLSSTVDVSDILNVGLTPTFFLKIDPAEFAKQIYLFHRSSYQMYKQRLSNPLCYIPQSLPSTTAPSHLLFTTSSPHFLTSFVNQHVLIDSHQMCSSQLDECVLRAMLIEHWIRVGEELLKLGDMCGWCSIAVSICSFAILRLRQSWKFVNQDLIERLTTIWSPILIQSNMFSTEIGSCGWQAYSTLGKLHVLDPPLTGITLPNAHLDDFTRASSGVPFFGVIRQFVERLRRHVRRYLDAPASGNNHQQPIVNFEKYWSMYDAIWTTLQRYQSPSQDDTVESLVIEPIGPIQAFFEHTQVNLLSVPNDYNVLQECSLECEPKPFMIGSSIRSPRKLKWLSESIAPPSSWILSFPQLVSSITKKDTLSGLIQPTTVRSMKMFQQQLPTARTSRLKKLAMPDTIPESEGNDKGNETRSPSTSSMQESSRGSRNRKRTYSFPSSRSISELGLDSSLSAVENMESNSRSWINPENYKKSQTISKSPFHAIVHIGAVGEKLLSVRDGELILQIDDLKESKPSFVATKPLLSIIPQSFVFESKPILDVSVRWTEDQGQGLEADGKIKAQKVKVKAGTFERLMDVLIYGLSEYSANVDSQDDFGEYVFSECRLSVDMEEYVHVFFITYRSFLSDTELLEYLRKSFMNASSIGRITKLRQKYSLKSMFETSFASNKPSEEADIKDWTYIARVRLQILDLIIYWVGHFFWDFINESANRKRTSQLIDQMTKSTEDMRVQVGELMEESTKINDEAERVFELIDTMDLKLVHLTNMLFISFLTPSLNHRIIGDLQLSSIDKCQVVEKYSTYVAQTKDDIKTASNSLAQSAYTPSKPGLPTLTQSPSPPVPKRPIPSVLVQLAATDILQQVDSIVQQMFTDITLQDWILLNDTLVTQSIDAYSWLPARKSVGSSVSSHMMTPPYTEQIGMSNVADDEVLISDIFIAIQGARRSTVATTTSTTENLMATLPDAIHQLFNLHFSIRSWIINELTSYTIDADQRAERMQKCIDVIVLSRLQMTTEPVFKELLNNPDQLDPLSNGGKVIPGFVEYSILSALVSPQVRLFVKSWTKTAEKNQAQSLDTPEVIIDAAVTIAQLTKSQAKSTRSRPYVVSIGWIIEMMLELGEDRTEAIRNSEPLVKFDQCQYFYNFWRFIRQVQALVREDSGMRMSESGDFTEKLRESLAPRLMDFLTASTQPWPALSLKGLREFASRENASIEKNKALSVSQAQSKLVSNSNHGASTISNKSMVFGKLVAKQQEKLKVDTKERDRIDREWREMQHKMQKKQLEQAKTIEKRERKLLKHQHGTSHQHQSSHLPWINSFLRGLKITHTNEQHQDMGGMGRDDSHPPDVLTVPIVTDNMKASNVINLINSTSSVASTYLKRDFVFRIVTEEGGQYLFQAMNDSNMHDWIRTINWAAKEGAARRLTVLVAQAENKRKSGTSDDLKFFDDRQRKKGKEVRGSIYGVDLSELMSSGKIPLVVEKCIDEIERRGLEEVGIYRVAGSGETVSYLRQQLNRNAINVNLGDDDWIDINVVVDAFKQFFRDLPQPLLTFDLYGDYMKASAVEDHDQRILAIKKVTKRLPTNNYILLKRLIEHFVVVTDYEAYNHMYATNLAIVFGPTLLRPEPGPVSFATTMANLGHQQNVVKNLITHYHFIFDVESEDCDREREPGEDSVGDQEEDHENVNDSE
ncbi:hypothetical protein BC943DRAFT_383562 [Umbelopsis sp. AD052]|nr:hypothetical protein BC943DRAFT_383562 [Umbelopsis sp. AD052]